MVHHHVTSLQAWPWLPQDRNADLRQPALGCPQQLGLRNFGRMYNVGRVYWLLGGSQNAGHKGFYPHLEPAMSAEIG